MSRAVGLVTAVHVLLLVCYSVLVPIFRAPDELLHVDQMRRLAGQADAPATAVPAVDPLAVDAPAVDAGATGTGPSVAPEVLAAAASSPAYTAGAPPVDIDDAVPPRDRPSFDELAAAPAPDPPDVANPIARRPPLTSWLGAAVLAVADIVLPGWPWSFDSTVALLRLVSVALVATVPLLAWASARRFGCPPRASLTAAVAVLAVPQLTHVGSVVGDDALVVALGAVVFYLGARVVSGDSSRRTAVLAGVSCGLALLTSGSALVLVPWMVGAYLLAPRRRAVGAASPGDRRLRRGRPIIVVALATVVGGWWHLGHLLADQGVQLGLDQPPRQGPGAGSSLASRLLADVWGAFGFREAVLPTVVVVGASVVLVGAIGVAFARGRVRAVRARLAFLVVPAAALAVLAVVAALRSTLSGDAVLRVEGRVVLVALVGLVVVAAVGLDQLRSPPTPALPAAVFGGAVGLQLLAMAAIILRYWTGTSLGERLRSVLSFSPWPPVLVFLATVGALAVVGWTLVELLRAWRWSSGGPPAPAATAATPAPLPGPGAA